MEVQDKRSESRVRYLWPAWFGYQNSGPLFSAQIHDLNRHAVKITVRQNQCPEVGAQVLTRFSYPKAETDGYGMGQYFEWSHVRRVEEWMPGLQRVTLMLHQPLDESPVDPIQEIHAVETV